MEQNNKRQKSRKEFNKEILRKLSDLIEKYPEQRFGQIIANYVFPDYREYDIFFEESSITFNRLDDGKNGGEVL